MKKVIFVVGLIGCLFLTSGCLTTTLPGFGTLSLDAPGDPVRKFTYEGRQNEDVFVVIRNSDTNVTRKDAAGIINKGVDKIIDGLIGDNDSVPETEN